MQALVDLANNSIYPAQGLVALWGVYCIILVFRGISIKEFRNRKQATEFMDNVLTLLEAREFEEVTALCDSQPFWKKAVPQLILVAISNMSRDAGTIRRMVAERFEREIVAEMEHLMSWVNTVVKSAPMLGLLGTVLGMISAFGNIAAQQKTGGVDPTMLANDISFALITTAVGLLIAIPLVVAGNLMHIRLSRLQDSVQQLLAEFFVEFDAARRSQRGGTA